MRLWLVSSVLLLVGCRSPLRIPVDFELTPRVGVEVSVPDSGAGFDDQALLYGLAGVVALAVLLWLFMPRRGKT